MGVSKHLALLLAIQLILVAMINVSAHTRVLELTMDRDLLALGTHDPCGQLNCRARGNSYTIESVTMTRVKAGGETTELLALTTSKPDIDVSSGGVRGNGTLDSNIAYIYLDLLEIEVCDSSYFICGVAFRKESGETQRAFSTAGPGQPPSLHPGLGLSESEHALDTPVNLHASELQLLKDQLNNVEAKFESLSDRLDRRLALVFDTIRSVDTSSRVSRLEDRVSSILLPQVPDSNPSNIMETLTVLATSLEEMNASVTALQEHQPQAEQPMVCVRGMGNDVTKRYPPYAIMTLDTLHRQVLCETQSNGGGWIVIQRRSKGDVDFYRDWTSYREGFGSITGDFWMGNEAIHQLTTSAAYELRVDIRFKGQDLFAEYAHFRIEDEANKYRLRVGQFTGTAGDGMTYSDNHQFSTFEADNDATAANCAIQYHSAWWHRACAKGNLNGRWGVPANEGNYWMWAPGKDPVSYSEMKIRRVKVTR